MKIWSEEQQIWGTHLIKKKGCQMQFANMVGKWSNNEAASHVFSNLPENILSNKFNLFNDECCVKIKYKVNNKSPTTKTPLVIKYVTFLNHFSFFK